MDVNKIETGLVDSSTTLEDSGVVKEYVDNREDPAAISQLWRGRYILYSVLIANSSPPGVSETIFYHLVNK